MPSVVVRLARLKVTLPNYCSRLSAGYETHATKCTTSTTTLRECSPHAMQHFLCLCSHCARPLYSLQDASAQAAKNMPSHLDIKWITGAKQRIPLGGHVRERYLDEYTSEPLPNPQIQESTIDELNSFYEHVWLGWVLKRPTPTRAAKS